jgi:tetratricopeptide (TPR) repeat protein
LFLTERAIRRFPEDPEIRYRYAVALLPFRPEDAPSQAARSVALDPDDPGRLVRAASVLLNLGQIEAAQSYLERAEELAPPDFIFAEELLALQARLAG